MAFQAEVIVWPEGSAKPSAQLAIEVEPVLLIVTAVVKPVFQVFIV